MQQNLDISSGMGPGLPRITEKLRLGLDRFLLFAALISRLRYNTYLNHITINKNTKIQRLKGSTVVPERHGCTQKYALQLNSAPSEKDTDNNALAPTKRKLELRGFGESRLNSNNASRLQLNMTHERFSDYRCRDSQNMGPQTLHTLWIRKTN